MNYSELSGMAQSQEWAAKYKAKIDIDNEAILAKRQTALDARQGIRVGDFVIDGERVLRVAHIWTAESIQLTDGTYGSSFYLGDGYVSYSGDSGGLDPGIDVNRFEDTGERRKGSCWFFSQDDWRAYNGYHTEAEFKVWRLRP